MFLEQESHRRLPLSTQAALNSRIAGAYARRGQIREAATRYRDVEDWNALASLLSREARRMIAAGSGKSWLEWQHWLPEHVRDGHPWLLYWEGYYLNFFDSRRANVAILQAQTAFASRGDLRASLLSISLLIDNFLPRYIAQDHTRLRHWIDLMGAQIAALPIDALSADDQLAIQSRLIAALVCTSVNDCVALHRAVDACMQAMAIAQDDEARLTAGTLLLAFAHGFRFDQAESMISFLEPLAEKDSIDATIRVWWHFQHSRWQFDLGGDLDRALRAMDCATTLVSVHGLQAVFDFRLNLKRLLMLVSMGNYHHAHSLISQMQIAFTPGRKVEEIRFRMVEALYHCSRGDLALAVSIGTDVFRDESRIDISERPRFARVIAGLHALAGNFPEAEAWSARAINCSACTDLDVSIQSRELLRAYQRLKDGNRKGAIAILRKELLRHRAGSTHAFLPRLPQIASTIAAFALEEGIEPAHVTEIIRRQHLLPGDFATPDWPWPVTVQVLGPLRISQGGVTRKSAGKTQQRPLLLLKALLLAGATGRQQHTLADQLWPDSDDAMTAMNTTLHRLRKLLGNDAAVTVTQGIVGLDPNIVWSDLHAFALILSRIDALPDMTPRSRVLYLQNAICRLYRGPLCDGDEEGWIAGARDRYRNHLVTAAAKLGARLEAMEAWSEACHLYLVAREAESLAEVIHRGLMRCAWHLEGVHGAAAAYRRCQETLSVVLGRKPSIETVKLAETMGLGRESQ